MLWKLERALKCDKKVVMQRDRFRQRTDYGHLSVLIESKFKHLLPGCEKEADKWGSKIPRQEKMLWVREKEGRWRSGKDLLLTEKCPALEGVPRGNVFTGQGLFSVGAVQAALFWKGKEGRRVNGTEPHSPVSAGLRAETVPKTFHLLLALM